MRPFQIVRYAPEGVYSPSPAPSTGEEIGAELAKLAEQHESWAEMNSENEYASRGHAFKAAIFYHLAADAYQMASNASIGHKRAERYLEMRGKLRQRAGKLVDVEV